MRLQERLQQWRASDPDWVGSKDKRRWAQFSKGLRDGAVKQELQHHLCRTPKQPLMKPAARLNKLRRRSERRHRKRRPIKRQQQLASGPLGKKCFRQACCSRCKTPFGWSFNRTSASKCSYWARPSQGGLKSPTPQADFQRDGGRTRAPRKRGPIDGTSGSGPSAPIAARWVTCRGFAPVGPHDRRILQQEQLGRASST